MTMTEHEAAGKPDTEAPRGSPRRVLVVAALVVAAAAGLTLSRGYFATAAPDGIITLSGRIEGDDAAVGARTGGRVLDISVREGDIVERGDPIAVLDDEQVRAREDQARATLTQTEARTKAARDQIAVLREQLHQAELQTEQAKLDAAGRVSLAHADLAAAEAQVAQQLAAYQLAAFDRDAYMKLAATGAVSERDSR